MGAWRLLYVGALTVRPLRSLRAAGPIWIAVVVALPVLFGIAYSALAVFGVVGAGASASPDATRLLAVFQDASTWRGLGWSVYVAAVSTALATAGAACVAMLFAQNNTLNTLGRSVATLPLPVPHLVAAATALFVLGQSGLLARLLHAMGLIDVPADMPALVYDHAGVGLITALAWKELPFLAVVAIALRSGHATELTEAAHTLGATSWHVARDITWPLLWRGLMPAVVATFVFAFGSYESAVLLAAIDPAPLPVLTMERFADPALARRGEAYGLALLALAVAALAVVAHEYTRARWSGLASENGTAR